MSAIDVRDIRKQFGDFTAVDGVSFAVQPGEVFGLLGPNGAGKSTLIRMLTTLLPPTSGTAIVGGHDVAPTPDGVRRAIGVIPQAMTSDTELSVEENLIIFSKLYGVPRDKRRRLIDELLAAVDLTEWRDKQVMYLSGGMRRRVEIARGLVHEPSIFFLDEPTTGLDPVSRVAVWEMIKKVKEERNLTVLLTTHYMDEADRLCDRIAIVDHGKLVALDSPLKLKASIPSQNAIEVSFSTVPAQLGGPPEGAAARAVGDQRRPHLPHRDDQRAGHHDGAGRRDGGGRRGRSVARASRARRSTMCSCTTPGGTCAMRCRIRRRGSSHAAVGGSTHASHLGHHRARAAALPPQPVADHHVADLPAACS